MSQNILNTSKVSELFFQTVKGSSAVHNWIWSNFELIQDLQFSLLPARMKKIQLKMKALECSHHYTMIFQMLKGR